ncbi:concanavalin A-like lectin/glucanase domain-containing protein [Echria macrotheca]|uniref:Concanavalin A-like lectin/glucanase domain-containing protein n=1 Tax=Echria macrotheca TaxID=438768 RepID=A0AAJ0BFH3_9PEZI|nr:concanavalin A-like lectin/glucanase domain-containing protein [Echria macrotheca]
MSTISLSLAGLLLLNGVFGLQIPAGYSRTLFEDDFSKLPAGSLPSGNKWNIVTGTSYPGGPSNWGTNEVEHYTGQTSNLAITSSGTLRITPQTDGQGWTSARIETINDFACPAGGKLRIEASLKFGSASQAQQMGIWPAFWSMGSDFRGNYHNWPAVGEIDIAESVNGASVVYQALHCGTVPGGPCDEYNGLKKISSFTRGVFHTVAVEIDRTNSGGSWRGESLTWYVDGRQQLTITGSGFSDEWVWTAVTRNPKYLLLNVAVGGDFPNNAENSGFVTTPTSETRGGEGSSLEVRYVAVWST